MRAFRVWSIFAAALFAVLFAVVPFAGEAPAQDWSPPLFADPRTNEGFERQLMRRDPGRDFVRGSAVYRLGRPADAATRWHAAAERAGDRQAGRELALSYFLGDGVPLDLQRPGRAGPARAPATARATPGRGCSTRPATAFPSRCSTTT